MARTLRAERSLKHLSPDIIEPNPENPRIVFRQEEMESLMVSIDKHGIQVPLTVYMDNGRYFLLDGERRWRCARKLNLETVPALVQPKPTELENLVLMYNIHALREQWDYFTIASKLERIILLFEAENGERPGEVTLSELTGLSRGAIRRCYLLLDLPDQFKEMILSELDLPKSQQKLSEDFFIEMERSLKTVSTRLPRYSDHLDEIRSVLIDKFKRGIIPAVTDFRQLSKMATAIEGLGIPQSHVIRSMDRIFSKNDYSIKNGFSDTVSFEYEEKKIVRYASSLLDFFEDFDIESDPSDLDDNLLEKLKELYKILGVFLKAEDAP